MTPYEDILARFSGEATDRPLYMPDLTLWYDYHRGRGTLPDGWQHITLPQIARELGVSIWAVAQPVREHAPTVEITTTEQGAGASFAPSSSPG